MNSRPPRSTTICGLRGRDRPEPGRDARSICDVQLPTQGHDSDAFADTQIHADHEYAFLHEQQGGVLTQQLVNGLALDAVHLSEWCPLNSSANSTQPS